MGVRIKDFIAFCESNGLSEKTITHYRDVLNLYQRHLQEQGIDFEDVTAPRSYLAELRNKGRAHSTIRVRYGVLCTFYQFLVNEGRLRGENPMMLINKPRKHRKYPDILTEQHINKLLNAKSVRSFESYRDAFLCYFLLGTGCRREEVVKLNIGDIDLTSNTVRIHGKGGKMRVVPFGHTLAEQLRKYMRYRISRRGESNALFVTREGRRLKPKSINFIIRRLSKRAGITDIKRTPHVFRHTFASRYILQPGARITTLSQLLGHASVSTTQRYIHMTAAEIAQEAFKCDPLRGIEFASNL